jgi:photosystem II stability/assembly factor-like uncharacterized protein
VGESTSGKRPHTTILRTTNGGETWASQSGPYSFTLFAVSFLDANVGIAVGGAGGIIRTTNGGATWTGQIIPVFALYGLSFVGPSNAVAVGAYGTILRTIDGGVTWTRQDSGTDYHLSGVSFVDANIGTVVSGRTILRTTTGGE